MPAFAGMTEFLFCDVFMNAPSKPHIFPLRVYFEDTDAGGIIYHANYLKFADRARTEMMRSIGADHAVMIRETGLMFVVKACHVEYHKPGRLDDALEVHSSVAKMGNASLTLSQNVLRDGQNLAALEIVLVCINAGGSPCRIPATIRAMIEANSA
jgi:acyl-CoA thioester hydrolase